MTRLPSRDLSASDTRSAQWFVRKPQPGRPAARAHPEPEDMRAVHGTVDRVDRNSYSALSARRERSDAKNQDCIDSEAVHGYASASMTIRPLNALLSACMTGSRRARADRPALL